MKKTLLLGGLLVAFLNASAQQRLALYEEFSGENCGPCATQNPGLWSTISAPGNDTKVLLLKYQSPIPSAGPIYLANTIFTDARMDYYAVNSAPSGTMNGGAVGSVSAVTQAAINSASSGTAPFTITISNPTYSSDGQSFTATATVTATTAATYSDLKLRFVVAEELNYTTAPGTNGETVFHNVIRQMYPSADGQSAPSSWTAGQSQTFTITGGMPSYVNPASAHRFFVAWLQTDSDKKVLQVGKTGNITIQKAPVDAAVVSLTGVNGLKCTTPATLTPTTVIKNTGTTTLTSATIYTRVGTGAWTPFSWTGSLAANATATVTLPSITVPAAGVQIISDSIAMPNGKIDFNSYDNVGTGVAYVLNSTAAPLPLSYDFEAVNSNWISWAGTASNGYPIIRAETGGQGLGYNGSEALGWFRGFSLQAGVVGYLLFPKADLVAGAKALDFYLAYGQYDENGTLKSDKLEVVYTTDCGTTWNSIWSQTGADLATGAPTSGNTPFRPNASNWKLRSVDLTNVPAGAFLAFKATSNYGNDLFIDNILIRTGAATGINNLTLNSESKIYPNPATDQLNIELDLAKATNAKFVIYNTVGQVINMPVSANLNAGKSTTTLNTSQLTPGIYFISIDSNEGTLKYKFTKK